MDWARHFSLRIKMAEILSHWLVQSDATFMPNLPSMPDATWAAIIPVILIVPGCVG
jgi:hypothetical protein